jgi:hypothetical protein
MQNYVHMQARTFTYAFASNDGEQNRETSLEEGDVLNAMDANAPLLSQTPHSALTSSYTHAHGWICRVGRDKTVARGLVQAQFYLITNVSVTWLLPPKRVALILSKRKVKEERHKQQATTE